MSNFKFGDKVQFIKLNDVHIQANINDSEDDEDCLPISHRDNSFIHLGDIGIIVHVGGAYCDVLFNPENMEERDHSFCYDAYTIGEDNLILNINKDHLMIHSDESEQVVLQEMMRIQALPRMINRRKYSTLEQTVIFEDKTLVVGCQNISKEDALRIAEDIKERYGSK